MGKTEKHRGSRTHGRGKKAGRGAGKRGGRGNAGLHKHKYMSVIKYDPGHFGRYGFKRPKLHYEKKFKIINVGQLEERLDNFLNEGYAKKKGDKTVVDLSSAGIDKLLGSGKLNKALQIKVNYASERAKSKVKEAGGEILLSEEKATEENTLEAE
jgi:large subunit ribosomal protein L15